MNPGPRDGRPNTTPVMGEQQMGIHPNQAEQPEGIGVPPGTILGYRADGRPIHAIAGGAETDDDPDVDVETDDGPDDEIDSGTDNEGEPEPDAQPKPRPPVKKAEVKPGDADYVPPSKAEWARAQAALRKANKEAELHRLRNKELEEKARGDETEHEKALREAREEGEKRFREPMKRSGMKAALVEAGFAAPDRLMKLVDWEALSVDEEGDLLGVEAEVDRMRSDYPEFVQQEKPKAKARPTGAPRPAAVDKPKSTAEIHANRILGRA